MKMISLLTAAYVGGMLQHPHLSEVAPASDDAPKPARKGGSHKE